MKLIKIIIFWYLILFIQVSLASNYSFSNKSSVQDTTKAKTCIDCHRTLVSKKIIHTPAEESCENCHASNGNVHPDAEKGFDLADNVPTLCFYCHEEYSQKNIHAPVESGECSMCHNSHSSDNPKLLNQSRTDKLCFECHDLEIPATDIVHIPVKKGSCNDCHDSHQSNNKSFLTKKTPELCFNCHSSVKEQMQMRKLHAPFEDACSNCHQPHSAAEKGLIMEKTSSLCYNCHSDIQEGLEDSKFVHTPMTDEKSCNNCHSPHASSENAILINAEKDLCLSCHNKTYSSESGKTNNIKQKLKAGNNIHAPVEEGCVICHKPHASNNIAILDNSFPSGSYSQAKEENFALCFECHDSGLLLNEFTTDATNFRNGNVNMHYIHIKGEKGRSCNTCHDSHGSKGQYLINDKVPFGNWEMDMNFVVNESGGSCATGCHAKKEYNRYIEPVIIAEGTSTTEPAKAIPTNRYQNYTEHIQSIDSNAIKRNEMLDKQWAERTDSIGSDVLVQENQKDSSAIVLADLTSGSVLPEPEVIKNEVEENIASDTITHKEETILNLAVVEETAKEVKPVESLKNEDESNSKEVVTNKVVDVIDFPIKSFAFSSAEIDHEGEQLVIKLVEYLKENPEFNIELQGHTDSIGPADYNLKLSLLRATKVKDMLVKNGIEISRIKVKGFGESKPLNSNSSPEERAQNRRVEFVILNKEN